jgi:hypothetical protein
VTTSGIAVPSPPAAANAWPHAAGLFAPADRPKGD